MNRLNTMESRLTSSTRAQNVESFLQVRKRSEEICRPLETEDYVIQSMDDVSPPKWHLGHVSWFFETFLLSRFAAGYKIYHEVYPFLFNSYYEAIGARWSRPKRGLLSRPTVREVYAYRKHVDQHMASLIDTRMAAESREFSFLLDLGLHHEQQHQELLITDIKHILSINPLKPAYAEPPQPEAGGVPLAKFLQMEGGLCEIGFEGFGFSFDNERPKHRVWLDDYTICNRLVTNREYLEFMEDGGYTQPLLWLSDGWYAVTDRGWNSPMYWEQQEGKWFVFTLAGLQPLNPDEPVSHVSYYEADAFARWSQKRLATEAEWEHAATVLNVSPAHGNFVESENFHPVPCRDSNQDPLLQMFGDVWEWTCSSYLPYPGFQPEPGAVGEYNGKFMSDQMILRGGSCATPRSHIRKTYRNFFQCDKRWQFSGIRLASDA